MFEEFFGSDEFILDSDDLRDNPTDETFDTGLPPDIFITGQKPDLWTTNEKADLWTTKP